MEDELSASLSSSATTSAAAVASTSNNSNNNNHHNVGQQYSAALAVLTLIDMDGLSYEEYFKKVEEMIDSLRQYWKLEQRVRALKIAIQLTKLLADTSQIKLYSKKYKMITDILDEFGRLIYIRIQSKASGQQEKEILITNKLRFEQQTINRRQQQQLDEQSTINIKNNSPPTLINNNEEENNLELAKDTCRNWFLKIASIRELVPRFYTELAILKVCDILLKKGNHHYVGSCGSGGGGGGGGGNSSNFSLTDEQFYSQSLKRLTKAAWGFGDPIVAIYARAYLCKVGLKLIDWDENEKNANTLFEIIMTNLEASSKLISQSNSYLILKMLQHQKLDSMIYFELISNALQSIINLVTLRPDVYNDNDDRLSEKTRDKLELMFNCLIKQANNERCSNFAKNIILHSTLRSIPGDIIADRANDILDSIKQTHKIWIELTKNSKINSNRNATTNSFYANNNYSSFTSNGSFENENFINQQQQQQLTFAPINDAQMISSSLYLTISSFAFALDSSDLFESNSSLELKSSLLKSIDIILEDLFNYEVNIRNNSISLNYLRSFKAWFSYANHYLTNQQLNLDSIVDQLLNRFVIRIKKDRQYIHQHSIILDLIKILYSNKKSLIEYRKVFQLKSFNSLLMLLSKDDHKLEASKWILETIRANLKLNKLHNNNNSDDCKIVKDFDEKIQDKLIINSILKLAIIINDSLSLLTPNDDIEHLSQLIIFFLDKIIILDYKEYLDLFSRCRGSLGNLNPIVEYLAKRILKLAIEFRSIEKKRNLRRNFLNGCLAYTFITIPAINDKLSKLNLYIEGSRLALDQMSLSLADYYLKQVLLNLNELLIQDKKLNLSPNNDNSNLIGPTECGNINFGIERTTSTTVTLLGENNNNKIKLSRISKPLLDQVYLLLELMLKYEDHIDLKHKLTLVNLIRITTLNENSNILKLLNNLNIIDSDNNNNCDNNNTDATS